MRGTSRGRWPASRDAFATVPRTVVAARTLGLSTGPSGRHLKRLFARWGLAETLAARTRTAPPGVPVAAWVASGEVALGFQQLSELVDVPGVRVLGSLPPAVQLLTGFSGVVLPACARPGEARGLLAFMALPEHAALKRRYGMMPALPAEASVP